MPDVDIVKFFNHYVVYIDDEIYCSCDTWAECIEELKLKGIDYA